MVAIVLNFKRLNEVSRYEFAKIWRTESKAQAS
jgi:hypothetical protein